MRLLWLLLTEDSGRSFSLPAKDGWDTVEVGENKKSKFALMTQSESPPCDSTNGIRVSTLSKVHVEY